VARAYNWWAMFPRAPPTSAITTTFWTVTITCSPNTIKNHRKLLVSNVENVWDPWEYFANSQVYGMCIKERCFLEDTGLRQPRCFRNMFEQQDGCFESYFWL
jgi:hypothetical protein